MRGVLSQGLPQLQAELSWWSEKLHSLMVDPAPSRAGDFLGPLEMALVTHN